MYADYSRLIISVSKETDSNTTGNVVNKVLNGLTPVVYSLSNAVQNTRVILYADDAVLTCAASTSLELQATLARDFNLIRDWYTENKLTINVNKTKLMYAGSNQVAHI